MAWHLLMNLHWHLDNIHVCLGHWRWKLGCVWSSSPVSERICIKLLSTRMDLAAHLDLRIRMKYTTKQVISYHHMIDNDINMLLQRWNYCTQTDPKLSLTKWVRNESFAYMGEKCLFTRQDFLSSSLSSLVWTMPTPNQISLTFSSKLC